MALSDETNSCDHIRCPITVNQTLTYLSANGDYTCENMFPYHPDRCTISFREQQELYWYVPKYSPSAKKLVRLTVCTHSPPLTVLEANLVPIARKINLFDCPQKSYTKLTSSYPQWPVLSVPL